MKSHKSTVQTQFMPLLGALLVNSQTSCWSDPVLVKAQPVVVSATSANKPQKAEKGGQTNSLDSPAALKSQKSGELSKQTKQSDAKVLAPKPPPGKDSSSNAPAATPLKGSSSTSKSRKHVTNKGQFIPPPPPVQPSLLLTPEFGGMPFLFGAMSKEELLSKNKEMTQQVKDMQDVLKEKQNLAQEAKEKAERFKPLFEEGVISRHELEATEKDALDAERELERTSRRASELQGQEHMLKGRLNELSARSSTTSKNTKIKKAKSR